MIFLDPDPLHAFEDEPLSSRPGITVALVLLGVVVGLAWKVWRS